MIRINLKVHYITIFSKQGIKLESKIFKKANILDKTNKQKTEAGEAFAKISIHFI